MREGPFTESKDLVAGFWLLQVRSFAEAVEWARRIPNPDAETFEVELRPVFEAEDFGDAFTPNCANRKNACARGSIPSPETETAR